MHGDLGPVLGAIMSCIAQSQVHAEFLRTKLMEFLLLCFFFPLEKSGHGEKQEEGMWILFGWETKRQTKEDEADSLWRRLLYCRIGAASASLSNYR